MIKTIDKNLKMEKKMRGFTMIELIVVIAILGLLSTIGLVSFRTAQIKGRDAQRKNDLSQIQKALEMYYNDYSYYPTDDYPASGSFIDAKGTLYMKEMPQDPKFGSYPYSSDGTFYLLYARLENSQDPCFESGLCNEDYGVTCGNENCNYSVASPNRIP